MRTIYKYPLQVADVQEVVLPSGAYMLSAQMQSGNLCLWALVDTNECLETRTVCMYGTGHRVNQAVEAMQFLGTVQMADGGLVFHLFCD